MQIISQDTFWVVFKANLFYTRIHKNLTAHSKPSGMCVTRKHTQEQTLPRRLQKEDVLVLSHHSPEGGEDL